MASGLARAQPQQGEEKLQGDKNAAALNLGGPTGGNRVSNLMSKNPECIDANETVFSAAKKMKQLNAGVLPVCEGRDNIVGVVTDRDLVVRGLAESATLESLKVRDVFTRDVQRVFEDDSIDSARDVMISKHLRRLLVFNKSTNKLSGILSVADLPGGQQWGGGSASTQSSNLSA